MFPNHIIDILVGERKITLRGTSEQIKAAASIIENIVKEEVENREACQDALITRPTRFRSSYQQPLFLTADNQIEEETAKSSKKDVGTEELSKTNDDSVTEVYVSSVRDPDLFYVQKVGPSSVALDKLSQEMTAYFEQDFNKVNLVKVSPVLL